MNNKLKINKEIEKGTTITLYKEDYYGEGWKIICNSLNIEDDIIIEELTEITVEISSIVNFS